MEAEELWQVYHAETKRQFAQRLRRFLEWVDSRALPSAIQKTSAQKDGCLCPFEQLNGFRYHDH